MAFIHTKKDKRKIVRVTTQAMILACLLFVILRTIFTFSEYMPYSEKDLSNSKESGFIALSYFGVAREATDKLISVDMLQEHLKTLHDEGYVTIGAQDVIDYYEKDKKLPAKSLFLMFEDGRKDTAIFAQKILEKFNYCATILTYGDNIINGNDKFLDGDQLKALENTSYYQLGSNGYRLSYINAFDRYENYIGNLEPTEFASVSNHLDRDYNHYLMDYIRDENRISKESYSEMESRITNDYKQLKKVYKKEVKEIPFVHILQHSNTGQFGTNDAVSSVNEENIKKMFKINFNREGSCFNTSTTSIYDLTRMQPQPYWTTNHLLMRIQDDTNTKVNFITRNRETNTTLLQGEKYFKEETLSLTTLPKGKATMALSKKALDDVRVSTTLSGNKAGAQTIYLHSDDTCDNAVYIELANDALVVGEVINGKRSTIKEVSLPEVVDGIEYQTLYENNMEGQIEVIKTRLKGNLSSKQKQAYTKKLNALKKQKENKGDKYIPTIDLKEAQTRELEATIKNDELFVFIDNKEVVKNIPISIAKGKVFIQSSWLEYVYSQRNLADDVYDGVFDKVLVTSQDKTIFDSRLKGFDKVKYDTTVYFNKIIDWFITTL